MTSVLNKIPLAIGLFVLTTSPIQGLLFDEYIAQVASRNIGVQAALKKIDALTLKITEKNASTTPVLTLEYGYLADNQMSTFSQFLGTNSTIHQANASVQTQFNNGIRLNTGYKVGRTNYPDSSFRDSFKRYSTATPYAELSMPIMKGANGISVKASQSGIEASYRSAIALNEFAIDNGLVKAETLYWKLALSIEAVELSEESVNRAQRMVDWAIRRDRLGLGDDSELLQVQTLLELRKMELKTAEQEAASVERQFNALRNVPLNQKVKNLKTIDDVQVSELREPKKGSRKDVVSMYYSLQANKSKTTVDIDNLEPALDLIGQLKFNQFHSSDTGAIERTFATDYPTVYLGVKFTAALDTNSATLDSARRGTTLLLESNELEYEDMVRTEANDWTNLIQQLRDKKRQLVLAKQIEDLQFKKWQNETSRQLKGRSTLLQVLTTEEDYADSRLSRLRIKAEVLRLNAQAKLFGSR